jgi:hypothetical protein
MNSEAISIATHMDMEPTAPHIFWRGTETGIVELVMRFLYVAGLVGRSAGLFAAAIRSGARHCLALRWMVSSAQADQDGLVDVASMSEPLLAA